MVESKYSVKILSIKEGQSYFSECINLTYTNEFFKYSKDRYGLDGGFLLVSENNENILVIPVNFKAQKLYSVYKDYTEPYYFRQDRQINWILLADTIRKNFGYKYVELYFGFINNNSRHSDNNYSHNISSYVLSLGEGESRETIFEKFKKKTRNEIRKSEKFNFQVKIGGENDLEAVYGLYRENMQRHGTPIRDIKFLFDLYFSYKKKLKMILVFDNNVLIGVNVFLLTDKYLKLLYNFSKTEYWAKCINNFLYFNTIEFGYKNGARFFDFGPSTNNDFKHIHFKIGFGGAQFPLVKIISCPKSLFVKQWLEQKRYNIKIRFNKLYKSIRRYDKMG